MNETRIAKNMLILRAETAINYLQHTVKDQAVVILRATSGPRYNPPTIHGFASVCSILSFLRVCDVSFLNQMMIYDVMPVLECLNSLLNATCRSTRINDVE
jgi:hypothetical protein